jgi:hypothetical protein
MWWRSRWKGSDRPFWVDQQADHDAFFNLNQPGNRTLNAHRSGAGLVRMDQSAAWTGSPPYLHSRPRRGSVSSCRFKGAPCTAQHSTCGLWLDMTCAQAEAATCSRTGSDPHLRKQARPKMHFSATKKDEGISRRLTDYTVLCSRICTSYEKKTETVNRTDTLKTAVCLLCVV